MSLEPAATPPRDSQPVPLPIAPPTPPNVGHQLTAEEAAFFETGELPAALRPPPAPPKPEVAPPTPPPAPEPAAAPRDEKGRFTPKTDAAPEPAPTTEFARIIAAEAARAAAAEAQLTTLQARLDELTKPKPPPAPDRNVDPLGALEHQIAEQTRLLAELRANHAREQEQRAEAEARAAFASSVRAMRTDFIKQTPDYDAAYNHLRASRLEELELIGLDQRQAEQQLAQEEFALAASEIRKGRNPIKTIYDIARRRGYSAPSAPPAPEDKLAAIRAGADAERSVERGGTPTEAELTLATARNASSTQLDKLTADESAWNKFTGAKTGLF